MVCCCRLEIVGEQFRERRDQRTPVPGPHLAAVQRQDGTHVRLRRVRRQLGHRLLLVLQPAPPPSSSPPPAGVRLCAAGQRQRSLPPPSSSPRNGRTRRSRHQADGFLLKSVGRWETNYNDWLVESFRFELVQSFWTCNCCVTKCLASAGSTSWIKMFLKAKEIKYARYLRGNPVLGYTTWRQVYTSKLSTTIK